MIKSNIRLKPWTLLLAAGVLLPAACTDANNKFAFDATPVDAGKSETAAPDTMGSADRAPEVTIQPVDTAIPDSPTIIIDTGSDAVPDTAGGADKAPEVAIQPSVDAARVDSPVDIVDAGAPRPSDSGVLDPADLGLDMPADSALPSGEDVATADADTD
jgi:hypothetical protein